MATCKKNTQYKSSCFIRLIVSFVLGLLMSSVGATEKITYYHNDALGSPVAATDEAGNLLWCEAYQPYGERLLKQGDATNSTWFTGKQEDKAAGLSYFHARWYDPVVGRFTAIDPVDFQEDNIHSFNRYAYANNNPYKYVDPDGNLSIIIHGTFANDATYLLPGQPFYNSVATTFNDYTIPFSWSGGNTVGARSDAAKSLSNVINSWNFKDGEKLNIIAHSHGGNIAKEYSNLSGSRNIDNLVTLGTPNRNDYQPNMDKVGNFINVYSNKDMVQIIGGGHLVGSTRRSLNANVQLRVNGSHSDYLRREVIEDKVKNYTK